MPGGGGNDVQVEFVDIPFRQFEILAEKYVDRDKGRIPLPVNSQQLWAQHKYSILSRNPEYYRETGPLVSKNKSREFFEQLSLEFVKRLALAPDHGRLINGLQHMWGYVSSYAPPPEPKNDLKLLLETIRTLSVKHQVTYLLHSTALSELMIYF